MSLLLTGGELEESAKNVRRQIKDPTTDHASFDYFLKIIFVTVADLLIGKKVTSLL